MVTVTMRETYDLSTKTNKMGMLAVHTPSMDTISRMWSGLVQNFRKIKIEKCDLRMACASVLPADPLQVGVEAGDIAPQDMFNPILYTAVSNDSFGTIQTRLYSLGYFNSSQSASVNMGQSPLPDDVDDFGVYYSLLASQGWKKAMPQSGLEMRSLKPLVHSLYVNTASNLDPSATVTSNAKISTVRIPSWTLNADSEESGTTVYGGFFKGNSTYMPAVPTMYYTSASPGYTDQYGSTIQAEPCVLPATYVACVITPPAKLNVLYYRLSVKWTITFSEPRPNTELSSLSNLAWEGNNRFYYTDYADQSKDMTSKTDMVDTVDVDIEKIM